jgi:hypothetical protein
MTVPPFDARLLMFTIALGKISRSLSQSLRAKWPPGSLSVNANEGNRMNEGPTELWDIDGVDAYLDCSKHLLYPLNQEC